MSWSLAGRTALITGGTRGIGFETAVALTRLGARVVIVGRDPARIDVAAEDIASRTGVRPEAYQCDLSSQAEIRTLAAGIHREIPRLDVLVNNAGGVHARRSVTVDGLEATFATNHLGYFLLTTLLLDLVIRSAPARIVSVASVGHRRGTMDFDDPGFTRGYGILRAYQRSKLANVLFANELARRLAGTGVTSNSVHPGSVATGIWSDVPFWAKPLIALFLRRTFITPEAGAATVVQLAAAPDLEGVTGQYFEHQRPVAPSALARDRELGRRLWELSERLTASA